MKLRSFVLILLLVGVGLAALFAVAINTPSVADYAQRYVPPFAIVFCYLFFCLIAIAIRVKRGWLVIYNAAFIFLALGIAELYFQLMPLWRVNDTELVFTDLSSGKRVPFYHAGDPDLGYANQPNITVSATKRSIRDGSIIYDAKYSIDERGLRKTLPENNNGILFFGDSITFGEGLNDKDTLPQEFSNVSGFCALNFAVSGYGPHHMLRELELDRPEKRGVNNPRAVVYTVMPEYVISRAAGLAPWDQRGPRYEIIDGEVKYLGSFNESRSLFDRIMSKSAVYVAVFKKYPSVPDSERDRQRFLAMMLKAKELVLQKYQAPFVIILWDAWVADAARSNAEWIARELKQNQVLTLQLATAVPSLNAIDNYIPLDYHPNEKANARLARELNSFLKPYLLDSSNAKSCDQVSRSDAK